jgi:dihydrofolate reductase
MRRIRYIVASSLDGFIAGPQGEYDWIIMDPDFDFAELWSRFDTILLGRRTFEVTLRPGAPGWMPGMQIIVFSRTLRQQDYPEVTMVAENPEGALTNLRSKPGKDIWLFGGGTLFRSLLEAHLVDTVEVVVMPVLLGEGIPLLPPPAKQTKLKLLGNKAYKTGIISLEYAVDYSTA